MSVRIKDRADRAQNLISLILCTLVDLHMKSGFICLNMVSFERNLILTVNGIFRRNHLEICKLSQSY